jgi:hypothetical protein
MILIGAHQEESRNWIGKSVGAMVWISSYVNKISKAETYAISPRKKLHPRGGFNGD